MFRSSLETLAAHQYGLHHWSGCTPTPDGMVDYITPSSMHRVTALGFDVVSVPSIPAAAGLIAVIRGVLSV